MTEEDLTGHTCTNFLIRLKFLLNKLHHGETCRVMATTEQHGNLPPSFFKEPFSSTLEPAGEGRVRIIIRKALEE